MQKKFTEKQIICCQIWRTVIVLFRTKKTLKCILVVANWSQFDSIIHLRPRSDQKALFNLLMQSFRMWRNFPLCKQIPHGKKQQCYRSETLLTINNMIFNFAPICYDGGYNASKEMTGTVFSYDLLQVLIELATVILLPIIFPLVHRNQIALICTFHKPENLSFWSFHAISPLSIIEEIFTYHYNIMYKFAYMNRFSCIPWQIGST